MNGLNCEIEEGDVQHSLHLSCLPHCNQTNSKAQQAHSLAAKDGFREFQPQIVSLVISRHRPVARPRLPASHAAAQQKAKIATAN